MTVTEAIKYLKNLESIGYGECKLRAYSDYADEFYPEAVFELRLDKDNSGAYDKSYGDWVEVG